MTPAIRLITFVVAWVVLVVHSYWLHLTHPDKALGRLWIDHPGQMAFGAALAVTLAAIYMWPRRTDDQR